MIILKRRYLEGRGAGTRRLHGDSRLGALRARASFFSCSCLGVAVIRTRLFAIGVLVVAVVFVRRLVV